MVGPWRRRCSWSLVPPNHVVGRHTHTCFGPSRRPPQLEAVDLRRRAKAHMDAPVVCGYVTATAIDRANLETAPSLDRQPRTHRVAIPTRAFKVDHQPVTAARRLVPQDNAGAF